VTPIATGQRSQTQAFLFCLAWVGTHLLVAALLEAAGWGPAPTLPTRYALWGTLAFAIQAPLLLAWLSAWKYATAWLVGGALLFAFTFFLAVPFMLGVSYSLCRSMFVPTCMQWSLLLTLVPVGLVLGLIQWLLGRRHARRTGWLIPAQIAGMAAFAIIFARAAFDQPSAIGEPLPAGVLASLTYSLVVALALPGLHRRPR
jgi:hypothetical protein